MKNFFAALTVALILTVASFAEVAEAAATFTAEQSEQMISLTAELSAVENPLPVDEMTFRRNFDDFIANFVREVDAGDDAAELQRLLSFNEPTVHIRDEGTVSVKNFFDRIAIVGLSDGENFKVLNLFATQLDGRDDALLNALILQAFVKSITPDFDSTSLLRAAKKNPKSPVTHGGVRYFISREGNLNIVTAIAE